MLTVGSFFSGCGLLDFGLTIAGLEHRWFAEVDPFRRQLLGRRWPGARIYDDVRAVGATAQRVDVAAGGFPCKGGSTAGKRNGLAHPETGLWREMVRAVGEIRPRFVVIENVANLLALHNGAVWGEVLGDLATLGLDVQWDCIPAAAFGATHLRDRVIAIAADPDQGGWGAGSELAAWPASAPGIDWPIVDGDGQDAPDPARKGGQGARPGRSALVGARANGAVITSDAHRDGVREQPEPEPGRSRAPVAGRGGEAAPRPTRQRRASTESTLQRSGLAPIPRAGVAVDWREYGPAIARWEAVHGPAPEPLVRRVDDGGAMRVERSRLSALGDGVQVQLGQLVGCYLMGLVTSPLDGGHVGHARTETQGERSESPSTKAS